MGADHGRLLAELSSVQDTTKRCLIIPSVIFCKLPMQAMEDVKEELRSLKEGGQGDLTEEQYEQKQQILLMKWFRTTGPTKLEAGIKHIEGLLEQGRLLQEHLAPISEIVGCVTTTADRSCHATASLVRPSLRLASTH